MAEVLAAAVPAEAGKDSYGSNIMVKTVDELRAMIVPVLQQALGGQLVCIFAHGNCAESLFVPGSSPWEVSLFVNGLDPKNIPDLSVAQKQLSKAGTDLHYIFTPEMVLHAGDTYPLEFLNLSERHILLHGALPIEKFHPLKPWLRLQCERELRGLLIHMHREVALRGTSTKDLQRLLSIAMPRFLPILHGVVWLVKNEEYPTDNLQCLKTIAQEWNLANLFTRMQQLPKDAIALRSLAGDYIMGMQTILQTIDQLEEST